MLDRYTNQLNQLKASGNYRLLRDDMCQPIANGELIDMSSNDYLGIGTNRALVEEFFDTVNVSALQMSSTASRLLSASQQQYYSLEKQLERLYGKPALLFNSGYHANTGVVSALASGDVLIVADKLVHASIIDGMVLSRSRFKRFRHNDLAHLREILQENQSEREILVVVESIYSMDGDKCDLKALAQMKRQFSNVILYVDEAHAFGVEGNKGLGLCEKEGVINDIDVIVGTFGKACASMGAFVVAAPEIKDYLVNCSRSFIFSTAIAPINCQWTEFVIGKMTEMADERLHLQHISAILQEFVNPLNNGIVSESQIVPLVIGDANKTLSVSEKLRERGYLALPIRKPTVPAGTERVRFSLSAAHSEEQVRDLITILREIV